MFSYLFNNNIVAPRPTDNSIEFGLLLKGGRVNEILALLRQPNHNINVNNLYSGYRPLHYACRIGSIELVLELLTQGAELCSEEYSKSIDGNYPIHIATIHGQRLIIEVLIRSGSDPSIPNDDGKIPLELTDSIDIKNLLLKDRNVHKSMSSLFSPMGVIRHEMVLLSAEKEKLDQNQHQQQQQDQDQDSILPLKLPYNTPNPLQISPTNGSPFKSKFSNDNMMMDSPFIRRETVRPIQDTPTKSDDYAGNLSNDLSSPSRDESYSAAWSPMLSHDKSKGLMEMALSLSSQKSDFSNIGAPPIDTYVNVNINNRRYSHEGTPRSQDNDEDAEMKVAILDAAKDTAESIRGSIDRWNNTRYIVQACQNMDKEKTKLIKINNLLQADPKLTSYRLNKLGDNISNLDGWCPMHCAAYYNRIDVVQVLLDNGASTWSRDLQGRTPLHIAAERGHEEMCEFLKEQMSKERNIVPIGENAPTDLGGTTPLGWAAIGSAARSHIDSKGVKDSMKKLLFSPGDKTILPRTPRSNRGGKSPWKAPGAIDRENLVFGFSEANGWKESMEDRICISCPVPGRPAWSFFAVLDGHGGSYVASYLAENLPHILVNEVTISTAPNTSPETIVEDAETTVTMLENLLMRVCATAEKRLADDPYLKVEILKSGNYSTPHDSSGSTGTLCLISSNYIAVANIGDTRAVRAHRDPAATSPLHISAIPMSRDHKFNIPEERARAIAAAATVTIIGDPTQYSNEDDIKYQVECPKYKGGGDKLRMSRSFGDFWLKNNKELHEDQQAVVAIPEIIIHTRSADDAFLVIACDGIFDVMNNDEVVNFIADKVGYNSFGGPVGGATPNIVADSCYSLLEHCVQLGAYDNLSCIVIMLGPPNTIRRRSTSPTHTPIQSLASTFAAKLEFESPIPGEKAHK